MLSIGQLAAAEAGVRPSLESIAPMEVGPNAGSVLAASNQAAGGAAAAPPAEEAARAPAAARAPDIGAPEILDLLWFDPAAPDAVRGCLRWQEVLERIQIMPPEVDYDDDPVPTPQSEKDENDVFGILAEADAEGPEALDDLVAEATSPKGRFTPPIAVVAGELTPAFEETEILKATFEAVAPFLATDKRLKETFDGVVEALKTPFVDRSNPAAAALGARLREAFAPTARGLAPGYLEGQIERALVEGRRYQRRPILGEPRILARLTQADGAPPIPVYLPEALAPKLPLFARFSARLFVEVHLQQDQYEPHPYALRALALGRVSRRAATRPRR